MDFRGMKYQKSNKIYIDNKKYSEELEKTMNVFTKYFSDELN